MSFRSVAPPGRELEGRLRDGEERIDALERERRKRNRFEEIRLGDAILSAVSDPLTNEVFLYARNARTGGTAVLLATLT